VIALLLLAEGFLVVSLNTLHLHFVHLYNEYGEPHYSLNGWWCEPPSLHLVLKKA
jgi:hypothetical protein